MDNVSKIEVEGIRGQGRFVRRAVAVAALLALSACGGGGGGGGSNDGASSGDGTGAVGDGGSGGTGGTPSTPVVTQQKPTAAEAARFLTQATMGPTEAEINRLTKMTYGDWLDEQFAKPQTLHRLYINQAAADLSAIGQQLSNTNFWDSWWSQALGADDQLRQRITFALSEIMVISFADATLRNQTRGVAAYYDMLGEKAFGNFRDMLDGVTYHPMMGIYLSHMKNQKEDPATGRVPDLNYAREITQLFTIGEWKLNADGTTQMGSDGKPLVAYTSADLSGESQVFTALSWYAGAATTDRTSRRFMGQDPDLSRDWMPMQAYDEYTAGTSYHSISQKTFLGTTIAPQTKPTTDADIKIVHDTLFNHPNVGPFIGKQLIQRLVTSNPSPAYVSRVTAAFNNNGKGVRGDMKAVYKAILLDPEARAVGTSATSGKLREPLLRLSSMLRAFGATSRTGRYTGIGLTDDPASSLGQTAMYAPTVFNFFRPGYVPSNTALMNANIVVPEMQIVNDVSVAGYMNYIRTWTSLNTARDIQHNYDAELPLATTPMALVDRINLLLFAGTMPDALKTQIGNAVASRTIPAPVYQNTPTTGGTLTKIANEGDSFTVTGTGTVRFGAGTTFVEKSVSGMGTCSNEFFGSDPVVGTAKACYLFTPTPVAMPASGAASGASAPMAAASAPAVPSNQAAIDAAKRDRVYLAVFMSMTSPDYLVQK